MHKQRLGILAASIVGIIASVLPWASMGPITVSGTQWGGVVTILFFIICGAMAYLGNRSTAVSGWQFWVSFAVALFTALVAIIKISDVSTQGASLGLGLILVCLSAVAIIGISFLLKKKA